jgi:spermidine synthase
MFRMGRRIARIVHKGMNHQDLIDVSELDGIRSLHIGSETIQSSMRVKNPDELVLTYSRAMMIFLLFHHNPQEVLLIGLGGGSIPKYLHRYLPQLKTKVIEIDPRVIEIAKSHFYLPENDEALEVVQGDGFAYINESLLTTDVLMLDAFDASGVPSELYSQDFFDACAQRLNPDGMLLVNLWGSDKNFDIYLGRIEQTFFGRVLILRTGKPGNIIVIGFKRAPRDLRWTTLRVRAKLLQETHHIEFLDFVEQLRDANSASSNRLTF